MTEVRKNIKLNEKDFVVYELTAYFASFTKNLAMLLMAAVFAFMIYYYKTTNTQYWLMVFSGVPTALYIASIVYFIPKQAIADFKISTYKDFQPRFTVTSDSITVERKSGNVSEIKLTELLSVWETAGYFYFYITKNNSITLPKRQLDKEETAFIKKTLSALPGKKRRNPYKMKFTHILGSIFTFAFITFVIGMIVLSFKSGV